MVLEALKADTLTPAGASDGTKDMVMLPADVDGGIFTEKDITLDEKPSSFTIGSEESNLPIAKVVIKMFKSHSHSVNRCFHPRSLII